MSSTALFDICIFGTGQTLTLQTSCERHHQVCTEKRFTFVIRFADRPCGPYGYKDKKLFFKNVLRQPIFCVRAHRPDKAPAVLCRCQSSRRAAVSRPRRRKRPHGRLTGTPPHATAHAHRAHRSSHDLGPRQPVPRRGTLRVTRTRRRTRPRRARCRYCP